MKEDTARNISDVASAEADPLCQRRDQCKITLRSLRVTTHSHIINLFPPLRSVFQNQFLKKSLILRLNQLIGDEGVV